MIHSMNLCPEPFKMIKSGEKTIELRLNDEKRQQVSVGDEIIFNNLNSEEKIKAVVMRIHRFQNFTELYNALPLDKCGYKVNEKADPSDMDIYYSKEQQALYGVVGIEIKLI